MSKHDGGPNYWSDLTLLDWFAGQALAGQMAQRTDFNSGWQEQVAWRAYSAAKVTLAEREKDRDG